MAYENGLRHQTAKSVVDLSTRQFHIVELVNSGGIADIDLAAAGGGWGVLQNKPRASEAATVATGGETRAKAGAAVTAGAYVTAANTGFAVVVASGALPSKAIGRAKTAAASGSIFTLELERNTITISGAANPPQ